MSIWSFIEQSQSKISLIFCRILTIFWFSFTIGFSMKCVDDIIPEKGSKVNINSLWAGGESIESKFDKTQFPSFLKSGISLARGI
jgi:hypothetical protein